MFFLCKIGESLFYEIFHLIVSFIFANQLKEIISYLFVASHW